MDSFEQQFIFVLGSLLCAGIAAIQDARRRRIPNILTALSVAAGLLLHNLAGGWRGMLDSACAGLIGGSLFLLIHVAGGLGAGDVKLMTAVGCLAGLSPLTMVVLASTIAGGVFALALSVSQGRLRTTLHGAGALLSHHAQFGLRPHPDLNLSNAQTLRMPFAVPVAAGCLFTLCSLAWEAR